MKTFDLKTAAAAASLAATIALTACGGGGDNNDGTSASSGGSGSSGGTTVACASSPVVTSSTRYVGVLPSGQVGEFRFDTAALSASATVNGVRADATLVRDDANCSFTSASTGALSTAFLGNGLAVSAAAVSGDILPALLVADPQSLVSEVAGTYNVLRYERDEQGGSTVRSSYATFHVDTAARWRLCPNAAYSETCANGPAGSLAANAGGGFDLVFANTTVGRVLPKTTANGKVLVVAVADTSDPTGAVRGLWIGASNEAFIAGTADGVYVTNTTDKTAALLTLAGLTARPASRTTAATILANDPVQGTFAIVTGDPTNDVGIATPDGLYADVTQASGGNAAFMRFGVKRTAN